MKESNTLTNETAAIRFNLNVVSCVRPLSSCAKEVIRRQQVNSNTVGSMMCSASKACSPMIHHLSVFTTAARRGSTHRLHAAEKWV